MSGMKKISGAIALTSLILWGAVSTVTKVSAQSQTTGGFEFGKFYTLLARPGKLSDCIIRVKIAYAKDAIEFKCVAFAPMEKSAYGKDEIEDADKVYYLYAGDPHDKSAVTFQVGIKTDSPRDSKTREFILDGPGFQFKRLGQVICDGGRKDGYQYSFCKAVSDTITVEGIYRLQE